MEAYNVSGYIFDEEDLKVIAEQLGFNINDYINEDTKEIDFEMLVDDIENDTGGLIDEFDFEDHAEELMNECYEIPENLINYIDYEAFARDLIMDYSCLEVGSTTYYYRS